MGRSKTPESIPQLKVIGLMPVKTVGNGDCLFNALSDQLHGDDSKAAEYRAAVVENMRANKDDYIPFISLLEGGATRRNPKRKAAGGNRYESTPVTTEQLNAAFEKRMKEMAQGGTWGDNHEIVAFSRVFHVDIAIWSEASNGWFRIAAPDDAGADKPTLYIVHHVYAHYSSIRNIDGPLTGLPNLQAQDRTAEGIAKMKRELLVVEDWRIDTVMKALPHPLNQPSNRTTVQKTLQQCNGNMDDAVHFLLPDSSPGTSSPSSVERDLDSDDEKNEKPHKKRDRRASRPNPLRSNLTVPVPGRDSLIISPNPIYLAAALNKVANDESKHFDPDGTQEKNWKDQILEDSSESPSSSVSRHSTPAPFRGGNASKPRIRIKLSKPRQPGLAKDNDSHSVASSQSSQSNLADTEADSKDASKSTKKESRLIAKPRSRLMTGHERARLMEQQSGRDSENDSMAPSLSHVNMLARNNSIKKLDSSIEAIHI